MTEENNNPETPRRDFIATSARVVALGGMATLAITQARKGKLLANDPNCIRLETCSDCIELDSGCKLDKAQAFRAAHADDKRLDKPADRPESDNS